MKRLVLLFLIVASNHLMSQTLSVYQSPRSVTETTEQLVFTIKKANLVYFETVSHHEIAAERGVTIGEMQEILFEDGGLTTSLIECQPTTALDLPLKILVWEENDDVYIAFIDPKFMKKRFMLSNCEEVVDDMGRLLAKVVVDGLRALQSQD